VAAEDQARWREPLLNEAATEWLFDRRRFARTLLDHGISTVAEQFGEDHPIGAYVPGTPPAFVPRYFFLAIRGDVEDDADWKRLVEIHGRLDELASNTPSRRLRFEVSTFRPALWEDFPSPLPLREAADRWFAR
jgi:hypothetical protein